MELLTYNRLLKLPRVKVIERCINQKEEGKKSVEAEYTGREDATKDETQDPKDKQKTNKGEEN